MKYTWDLRKNASNIRKHGIDLADVIEVFEHPMLVREDDREDYDEQRWIGLGVMQAHVIVVVYVEIHDDHIHLISARKANRREINRYEENLYY